MVENVQRNNGSYFVAVQGIDSFKTSTYQQLCIYPEIKSIIYDWYWSMSYTYDMDSTNGEFIFPEFERILFKSGDTRIDSKVSHMFRNLYERFYRIVQNYRTST